MDNRHSILILASSSPRRAQIMQDNGFAPDKIAIPDIDESRLRGEKVPQLATRLARAKAQAVMDTGVAPHDYVIAGDTIVTCAQRILPKCETREQALKCWQTLQGRRHRVYGGIACGHNGKISSRVVCTIVKFALLDRAQIECYLDGNEWSGKAGGYAIQGLAQRHIVSISGSYSNVVGLCANSTYNLLKGLGYS